MQATTRIRHLTLGAGSPKICVPVLGKTQEEILASAKEVMAHRPDIVEWRADFWEGSGLFCRSNGKENAANGTARTAGEKSVDGTARTAEAELTELLARLREELDDTPLLFTFRTKAEGGERALAAEEYVHLNETAVTSGYVDAIDVELFLGEETVRRLVAAAHGAFMKVIGSNHDFQKTPPQEEIVRRLCRIQELGMDVAKIAVMPADSADVLTLLAATEKMKSGNAKTPVITMAMGGLGMVSRLCGEVFGSALTFGMAGRASAPGQIPVEELRKALALIHGNLPAAQGEKSVVRGEKR